MTATPMVGRAFCVALLAGLALASPACAACAWVLWGSVSVDLRSDTWSIVQAVESRSACEELIPEKVRSRAVFFMVGIGAEKGNVPRSTTVGDYTVWETTTGRVTVGKEGVSVLYHGTTQGAGPRSRDDQFKCLPDTIDPRGPKGGGR
jgi:hypothetical protein